MLSLLFTIFGFTLSDAFERKVTVDSLIIQENRGESRLVVQTRDTGTFGETGYKSEIWAIQYSDTNGKVKTQWKLYDFNSNALESLEFQKGSHRIVDINQDSRQDVFLWYWKVTDGMDPDTLKVFLYVSGKKYAIRGTIPKTAEDIERYAKHADKGLKTAPIQIRKALDQQWEDIVNPRIDSLKAESSFE